MAGEGAGLRGRKLGKEEGTENRPCDFMPDLISGHSVVSRKLDVEGAEGLAAPDAFVHPLMAATKMLSRTYISAYCVCVCDTASIT